MKIRFIKMLAILAAIGIFWPFVANAQSIINSNGIEITEEEYNNFIKLHSHEFIMTMTQEEYEKLLTLDYDNIVKTTKYIATTYNPSLNLTTQVELSKYEYDHFMIPESGSMGLENIYGTNFNYAGISMETTAKEMVMTFSPGTVWHYAVLTASWKYLPTTRVFDVIGFRGTGFTVREGSQTGHQMYIDASGVYHSISYAWNGTNIKKFDNGYGISMNLVNPTIQALVLDTTCDIRADETHPSLNGAYEHAINSSVTLAQSQNYTLGGSGLGSVFVYPYSISSKYDGMNGLQLDF